MSSQRYERISDNDDHNDDDSRPPSPIAQPSHRVPSSPPPSFHSRASSPRRRTDRDPLVSAADRELADTFGSPSDTDSDDEDETHGSSSYRRLDDRQRVMSGRDSVAGTTSQAQDSDGPQVERRITQLPAFAPATSESRRAGPNSMNDGVFANLSAKPSAGGDDLEEKPPSYEQAAADATPPYWENTIFAPSGSSSSDDVYIDGLPVGSLFSFVWNGMISMSFQLVGFLLTYLLHSTHAAKNGSKAGLGITLIQYGFSLKGASSSSSPPEGEDGADGGGGGGGAGNGNGSPGFSTPSDPNNHNFDPNNPIAGAFISSAGDATDVGGPGGGPGNGFTLGASDWFAYALMIVGWFVLIRAISEYLKARRHEQLVLQSPSRGLNVAVVAEGEEPSGAV